VRRIVVGVCFGVLEPFGRSRLGQLFLPPRSVAQRLCSIKSLRLSVVEVEVVGAGVQVEMVFRSGPLD